MRKLGRPREFVHADVPGYLRHWHAPRANRWERLHVAAAALDMQRLEPGRIVTRTLRAGETCWIAPGTRWRLDPVAPDARFMLDIHADETSSAAVPQKARSAWLRTRVPVVLKDAAALTALLATLEPGDYQLVQARFALAIPMAAALAEAGHTLARHPLAADRDGHVALIVHTLQVVTLADYLARDHAVIEAALACALEDGDRRHWLRHVLGRHLGIEETLLFPAWLAAGAERAMVDGLLREHADLRAHLGRLDEPASLRRFLLMLEAHDEKEERQVYPAMMDLLESRADELTRKAMCRP